jgi:hypothetical protein
MVRGIWNFRYGEGERQEKEKEKERECVYVSTYLHILAKIIP